MTPSPIRVLVVDDHPIVRKGLCSEINLDRDMQVVGLAQDGNEAVAMSRQLKPDVVLMDIVMPQKNGIEATREILADSPETSILVITSFTDEGNIYAAIQAGAMGVIYKDKPPEDVLQAIRDVRQGIPHLSPSLTRRLFREIRQPHEDTADLLTVRETEILRSVARGKPYKEIALETGIRETTVRAHVSNILNKLNLSNRSQLVLYAVNKKLIDPGEAEGL